ncbi:MAG TPA: hypothetical protein PK280_12310 [Planctomycetota bacterium]|nr:hypothetical protein [Planctomycetota bacterium]
MPNVPTNRLSRILQAVEGQGFSTRTVAVAPWAPVAGWNITVASDRQSRERAWRLVHEVYCDKGYQPNRDLGMRLLLQDALPESTTFLAESDPHGTHPLATLTLIPDSPLGLPMDALYGRELDALRAAGRRPCEIAKLVACVEERSGMELLLHLFKLAYLSARRLGDCTDFVVTVSPRHEKYYRRLLLFEPIGETRPYDAVNGVLASPLRLDLLTAEDRYREKFGRMSGPGNLHAFFVNDQEPAILDWLRSGRRPMSEEDLRHFMVERSDLLERASADDRMYLQSRYLACDFERMFLEAEVVMPQTEGIGA